MYFFSFTNAVITARKIKASGGSCRIVPELVGWRIILQEF